MTDSKALFDSLSNTQDHNHAKDPLPPEVEARMEMQRKMAERARKEANDPHSKILAHNDQNRMARRHTADTPANEVDVKPLSKDQKENIDRGIG